MVMKHSWLIITFVMMQNVCAMNKSQEIKGEFKNNQFLRPIETNDLPNLIGKAVMYQTTSHNEGILGEKIGTDYYRVYLNPDKTKGIICNAKELYYAEK